MKENLVKLLFLTALLSQPLQALDAGSQAHEIFEKITGVPLQNTDPRLVTMSNLITNGKLKEAAAIATDDSNFYDVTLRNWAAGMDGKEDSTLTPFSDYQALLIGAVRDDVDFRTILTG